MADYLFVTIWRFDAPIDQVWNAIFHSENWPVWWKNVERVEELEAGDAGGVGSLRRYYWRTELPYRLVFTSRTTDIERLARLRGQVEGELEGSGLWELTYHDGITTVRYTWQVRTTRRWMNLLAPLARPFFAWNHDQVMHNGGESLARLLGVRMLDLDEERLAKARE